MKGRLKDAVVQYQKAVQLSLITRLRGSTWD